MAGSMAEALAKAGLIKKSQAKQVDNAKREELKDEERHGEITAILRRAQDEDAVKRKETFLRKASKEATQASSRVGTPQYYSRFKK